MTEDPHPGPSQIRPRRKRAARIGSFAALTAALVISADIATTILWQEPISALYTSVAQSSAAGDLDDLAESFEATEPTGSGATASAGEPGDGAGDGPAAAVTQPGALAKRFKRLIEAGKAVGRIKVPAVGIESVFVEGTDLGALRTGPGHYPGTSLPGQGGTVAIAGHRTTYGAPFHDLDSLEPADTITLETPYATATYSVRQTRIVEPTELGIIDPRPGAERLVLTACHPLHSLAQRIAVFARLTSIEPRAGTGSIS